jgi:hypothetical protein
MSERGQSPLGTCQQLRKGVDRSKLKCSIGGLLQATLIARTLEREDWLRKGVDRLIPGPRRNPLGG